MGRCINYAKTALTLGVVFGISIGVVSDAKAATGSVWAGSSIVKERDVVENPFPSARSNCSGEVHPIAIEGWNELRESCVFGYDGGVQVARYAGSSGVYVYAVKFPLDSEFISVKDLCVGAARCAYGQQADTMAIQLQAQRGLSTMLVKDFTKHLVRYTDDGVYFRFLLPHGSPVISVGSSPARTVAISVSPGGQWALVELEELGFVRVNLQTLEYRRVVAPGAQYGYGVDPTYELSITDDGTKVAVVGWNAGIAIYEVNGACGDALTNESIAYFSPYTQACTQASLSVYALFPAFVSAHVPRFSRDGTRLTVVVKEGQQIKRATLTPSVYASSPAAEPTYVAFGDSFTSGEGEEADMFYLPSTNTNDNHCHVSTRSYPYLIGSSWGVPTLNNACSGSRIAGVREASRSLATGTTEYSSPTYLSIGVGGNDIDLMGKLKTCLGVGTCEWASDERRRATAEEIRAQFSRLVQLVADMRATYQKAAIALIGYPSVVNTDTTASCGVVMKSLLNTDERRYMDESIRYLNKVIRAAAHYSGVSYIDSEDALVGERLCDQSERAMNAVRFGDDIAPISQLANIKVFGAESFHPTPRGHQMVAEKIRHNPEAPWWNAENCTSCVLDTPDIEESSYWQGGSSTQLATTQRAVSFLSSSDIKSEASLRFAFPPGFFTPGSRVVFELHSTPTYLGEYSVESDGSLEGSLKISSADGYHTLHAYGQTFSGEPIDAYETVAVESQNKVSIGSSSPPSAPTTTGPLYGNQDEADRLGAATSNFQKNQRTALSPLFSVAQAVKPVSVKQAPVPTAQVMLLIFISALVCLTTVGSLLGFVLKKKWSRATIERIQDT